jgi:SAM-dependent methyltransferase
MKVYDKYGIYYDLIYSMKNYKAECETLENYFRKFSKRKVHSILDLGCGTGTHCIIFAKKGYEVSGVDLSEVMIAQAMKKAKKTGVSANFYVGDMRKLNLKRKFDVITCLFGTIDYCLSDDELKRTLKVVKKHLESKGLFIFDFWPIFVGVRKHWQSVGEIKGGKLSLIRIMDNLFDPERNVIKIKIKCVVIKDNSLIDSFDEEHNLRVFSVPEITHFLNENGFKCLGFFKVNWRAEKPYTMEKIDLETTNVVCIATI